MVTTASFSATSPPPPSPRLGSLSSSPADTPRTRHASAGCTTLPQHRTETLHALVRCLGGFTHLGRGRWEGSALIGDQGHPQGPRPSHRERTAATGWGGLERRRP